MNLVIGHDWMTAFGCQFSPGGATEFESNGLVTSDEESEPVRNEFFCQFQKTAYGSKTLAELSRSSTERKRANLTTGKIEKYRLTPAGN